jgi:hypothetical protein
MFRHGGLRDAVTVLVLAYLVVSAWRTMRKLWHRQAYALGAE